MNIFDDIKELHLAFGHPVETVPGFHDEDSTELGLKLVDEEYEELRIAIRRKDIKETADAIADSIVVLTGLAHRLGIPLPGCWAEVHRSNMDKAPGGVVTYREDGKVLKPAGWRGPDIEGVLVRHGWTGHTITAEAKALEGEG